VSHHAATLANDLENFYYTHNAPAKGGHPKGLNPLPALGSRSASGILTSAHLPAPAPVPLLVEPALPGEGQWRPVGVYVHGVPAMYEAQFRADRIYTSQITSAVWIDPTVLKVGLVPGTQEPGGTWPQTPYINQSQLPKVVAAFNGGFRMQDAHGGFYLDGRTQVPLRAGAASMVIYSSGRVDIGTWNQEVSMTRGVVAVLQNLVPLVDRGQTAPDATYNDTSIWGSTLGANTVVARSGIGVTSSGALVYVAGPALTARTLAESLQRVGAVRAMALDLNPEWVTFNFYEHSSPGAPTVTGVKLYPQMQRPSTRYLGPEHESRDFLTVSLS
jgi:Phosphodiester glycosidase